MVNIIYGEFFFEKYFQMDNSIDRSHSLHPIAASPYNLSSEQGYAKVAFSRKTPLKTKHLAE